MLILNNINKCYKDKVIFDDMSVSFDKPGKIYALLGESGSGKTTLLHILFGLDHKYTGNYFINGKNAKEFSEKDWDRCRNEEMQIVYQDFKLLNHMTVYENLQYAINENNQPTEERIKRALEEMDLQDAAKQRVNKLSGGEKQRLALARAVINQPHILLLDEPTGNLDQKNTELAMSYVQRLAQRGIMVIVITHDMRVLNYVDCIYRLENKTLVLSENKDTKEEIEIKNEPHERLKRKKGIFPFTIRDMKANVRDLWIHCLPILAIFIVFILIFNMVFSTQQSAFAEFYNGIGDKLIALDLNNLTDDYINKMNENNIHLMGGCGGKIGFSEQDLQDIKNIDGVQDAVIAQLGTLSVTDLSHMTITQNIKQDELADSIKNMPSFARMRESISMQFNSLASPYDFFKEYNPQNINLMFGDAPKDKTDQILIPDVLALTEAQKRNVSTEELIGQTLSLEVKELKYENGNALDTPKTTKEYPICGIYSTNYNHYIEPEQTIYTSFTGDQEIPVTAETYNYEKEIYDRQNETSKEYYKEYYESFDAFKAAYGTGFRQAIIKLTDPGKAKQVTEALNKLFPNYQPQSQYDFKHGAMSNIYHTTVSLFAWVMLAAALLFGIILTFITRSYSKRKNKEMAILYSLGYTRWQVSRNIIYENLINTGICLGAAYGIVALVHHFYLQYSPNYQWFETIFTGESVAKVCGFTILMMMIATLWAVFGVRKSKLKKYLET